MGVETGGLGDKVLPDLCCPHTPLEEDPGMRPHPALWPLGHSSSLASVGMAIATGPSREGGWTSWAVVRGEGG